MKRLSIEMCNAQLAALASMDKPTLRALWQKLYGNPPPPKIRETLLRRAVAYQLQVLTYGGLKPSTIRQLRHLAEDLRSQRERRIATTDRSAAPQRSPQPPRRVAPGTRLLREWNRSTEVVDVTAEGFEWKGTVYPSLSAVALAITGTKWSGPRFFGLNQRTGARRHSPPEATPPGTAPTGPLESGSHG